MLKELCFFKEQKLKSRDCSEKEEKYRKHQVEKRRNIFISGQRPKTQRKDVYCSTSRVRRVSVYSVQDIERE